MKTTLFALWIGAVCAVCLGCGGGDDPEPAPTATSAKITAAQIANATYTGIYDEPIALTDGVYEGAPFVEGGAARPRVEWARDLYRIDDVDGDGTEEAVVLLSESSGGSGENLYLSVVGIVDGAAVSLATELIGDRVQVSDLQVHERQVVLDLVEPDADDAACCPTNMTKRSWTLFDNSLVPTSTTLVGTLSLDVMDGSAWVLSRFDMHEPVAEGIRIDLRFDGGKVAGSGGCNRYFANVTDEGQLAMSVGLIAATKMACPGEQMQAEDRYLSRLQHVNRYGFWLGRLALTWHVDDRVGTLIFDHAAEDDPADGSH